MDTPKQLHFITISKKLDDKKRKSVIEKIRDSYWRQYNLSLSIKENFIVWAHDVQGMTYPEIGEIFGLKKSRICDVYYDAKKKLGGEKS